MITREPERAVVKASDALWNPQQANSQQIRRTDILAICVLGFLAISAIAIGFVPVIIYTHDLFIPLDGAWRVLNGQRPHADFLTPLGPVFYLIEAGGLLLAGGSAKGLAYASVITSTVFSAWAYLVARGRLRSGASIAFAVFIFVLTFAPVALGDRNPAWHTYAMEYTRWGVSLMCILLLESVLCESASRAAELSTGIICALLLFLKVNLFIIALGLVAISLFFHYDVRRIRRIAIGFLLFALPIAAYIRFDFDAMLRDFRMAAASRSQIVSGEGVTSLIERNWDTLAVTMLFAVFIAAHNGPTALKSRLRYPAYCLAIYGAGTLLQITNYEPSGMPLSAVFALICSSWLYTLSKQDRGLKSQLAVCLMFWGAAFIVSSMYTDVLSIGHAVAIKYFSTVSPPARFDTEALDGFATIGLIDVPPRPTDGQWLAQYVNDGLALLRENTSSRESVISLDYVNPFSFALKRPPNKGGAVWLILVPDQVNSASRMFLRPDPSMFLGTADVVMIPKWPNATQADFEGTLRAYGAYISEHFDKAAESKLWILEKRNHNP